MKKNIMRINYAQAVYDNKEKQAVMKSLENTFLSVGKNSAEFEKKIAKIFGKKYAVFVNSGSSANLLVSQLIPPGEVITPALTFATTLTPLLQTNHKPVFVDSDPFTFLPTIDDIRSKITSKTVAIMIPDLLGNRMDSRLIRSFCDKHRLLYIQDSCDTIIKQKAGGHFVTTSFYGSHIITAMGGGGMIMSDDKKAIDRIRTMRDWGRGVDVSEKIEDRYKYEIDGYPYDGKFVYTERGFNMRPIDAQAAFGLEQLKKLPKFIQIRRKNFDNLYRFFSQYKEYFNLPKSKFNPNWLAFPLTIKHYTPFTRFQLVRWFEKENIQTRPIFSGNITKHPAFKSEGKFPNADYVMENGILIGIHQGMTKKQLDYVKQSFNRFLWTIGKAPKS